MATSESGKVAIMKISCPNCQREHEIEEPQPGKKAQCVNCEVIFEALDPEVGITMSTFAAEPRQKISPPFSEELSPTTIQDAQGPGSRKSPRHTFSPSGSELYDSDLRAPKYGLLRGILRTNWGVRGLLFLIVVILVILRAIFGPEESTGQPPKRDLQHRQASRKIREVNRAVKIYFLDHSKWPGSLKELLVKSPKGIGPYLNDAEAIRDPWGKPFGYDPDHLNNRGEIQPRIWVRSEQGLGISNLTTHP